MIGTDWWEPICDPLSGKIYGQVQILIALGSEAQIQRLKDRRGFKKEAVFAKPTKAQIAQNRSKQTKEAGRKQSVIKVNNPQGKESGSPAKTNNSLDEFPHKSIIDIGSKSRDQNKSNTQSKPTIQSKSNIERNSTIQSKSNIGNNSNIQSKANIQSKSNNQSNSNIENKSLIKNKSHTQNKSSSSTIKSSNLTTAEVLKEDKSVQSFEMESDPNTPKQDMLGTLLEQLMNRQRNVWVENSTNTDEVPEEDNKDSEPPKSDAVKKTADLLDSLQKVLDVSAAQNSNESPVKKTTFKAHVIVESALHLPSRKKCKSKKSKNKNYKLEEILPSTYVTFEVGNETKVSPIVQKSTSPNWDYRSDVQIPVDLLCDVSMWL